MAIVEVITRIEAPPQRCFYLALSLDVHPASAGPTHEQVISIRQRGLLELGESVTFRARHFGIWQTLTSKITEYQLPSYFCDEMQQGAFKALRHEHYFEADATGTLMRDVLCFASPLGWLGRLVDSLVLSSYLKRFLARRGQVIRHYAETEVWRTVLPSGKW